MDQPAPDYQNPTPPPPPASQPSVITSPSPGSPNRKKIIFGILGILLLTAGTVTSVFLIQNQKQITKSKASDVCPGWCTGTSAENKGECPANHDYVFPYPYCGTLGCCSEPNTIPGPTNEAGQLDCTISWEGVTGCFTVPAGCNVSGFRKFTRSASRGTTDGDCVGTSTNPVDLTLTGGTYCPRNMADFCEQCVQIDHPADGGGTAQYTGDCPIQPTPTQPPSESPLPTPTQPPSIAIIAQCLNVLAYSTSWNPLSPADLSRLEPGDTVFFTVQGSSSDNGITQARFIINGTQNTPVTALKPGTDNEFYDSYVIPDLMPAENTLTVTIKGELYHPALGWF